MDVSVMDMLTLNKTLWTWPDDGTGFNVNTANILSYKKYYIH